MEGRSVAQMDAQCSQQYAFFLRGDQWPTTVHTFCDHGDVCAFLLPLLSNLWATDLFGDVRATVLNMLKTSGRPWRPWRCLNVLWTTKATVRPPFCLQRRPGQFCGRTREAQRSQPLCKGGISNWWSVTGFCVDWHTDQIPTVFLVSIYKGDYL